MPTTITQLREPTEFAQALARIAGQFPREEQAAYLETLAALASGPKAAEQLVVFAAHDNAQWIGTLLAQVLPGRAALFWPPQSTSDEVATEIVRHVLHVLAERDIVLAQALLHVDGSHNVRPFIDAGFHDAGELIYLYASNEAFLSEPDESELTFDIVSPRDPELAAVIERTYRDSLDCPLVDGWRSMEDVIASYLGTGTHRPKLWRIVRSRGETVGCLLLADFPQQAQGELVYLGVCLEFRGRHYGAAITRWALHAAHSQRWQQLVLAVDAANVPAIRAYSICGFEQLARRRVLVLRI